MSDEQVGCEWVTVSSAVKRLCVCVCTSLVGAIIITKVYTMCAFTPRLTPLCLTLLETSASYSTNTLPFLTRSHLSPNPVFVHTSMPKQLPPSPLPLFTPSLTTATLFITTCPSLRSPGSNRSRTLLHVLLWKLPNPVTSLPSLGLCTG